jgi:hypothetical protein
MLNLYERLRVHRHFLRLHDWLKIQLRLLSDRHLTGARIEKLGLSLHHLGQLWLVLFQTVLFRLA